MKIFLIGMPGSGKTTLGRQLADIFDVRFIELDDHIARREGLSITDVFIQKGEEHFRSIEAEMLRNLAKTNSQFVMSCGGGTPCYHQNMDFINRTGRSIFLQVSYQELAKRLKNGPPNVRPLIKDLDPDDLAVGLEKKFGHRTQTYQWARHVIKDDHLTVSRLIKVIEGSF